MKTMIEILPITKPHFMHSNPSRGHIIALLLLIAPIVGLSFTKTSIANIVIGSMIGVVYWSFFEYAMHRFIYHRIFKEKIFNQFWQSFHLYHHRNLEDKNVLNANYLFILPMALINTLLLYGICLFKIEYFIFAIITLILSYMFYEWVHYSIHTNPSKNSYIEFISKYHLYHHHNRPLKNFGNTTPIWDYLLGTYDPGYRKIDLTKVKY